MQECRDKLYARYGKNYDIVNWGKTLKGGFLGLFNRMVVEVNYIVDDNLENSGYAGQSADVPEQGRYERSRRQKNQPGANYYNRENINVARNPVRATASGTEPDSFASARDRILESQIEKGVTATNLLQVANLTKQIEQINKKLDDMSYSAAAQEEHPTLSRIEELLLQNEFTPSYIKKLKNRIRTSLSLEELDDFETVQAHVVDWIGEDIKIAPKFSNKAKGKNCHVIVIVGPTGVGKTTTVAKMAAKIMVSSKETDYTPRILLISIDTVRVGALVQLEHWGETMGLEVREATDAGILQALYDDYKDKMDFIFIDTSGCSHYDLEAIAKIHKILSVDNLKPDMYLAVTAGTKARDLEGIIRNYESFEFRSVILTKCDETASYGNVLSVLAEKGKAISMITDGQKVLNYLKRAHPYYFLRSLQGFQVDKKHIIEKYGPLEDENEKG